jgi:16S rRNA (guanine527-N7)-methyltransferase
VQNEIIRRYFPSLSAEQYERFDQLLSLYASWNEKINVISRKDTENFYERHVLHSLSIAKVFSFQTGEKVLDIGTGGGFPGIPLAIFYPDVHFTLSDSIAKKIKVVEAVVNALHLTNVTPVAARAETIREPFDYIVTRAVAKTGELIGWSRNKHPKQIIALKGGDLKDELSGLKKNIRILDLKDFFEEAFFETKKMVVIQ